ncbi:MAG: pyrimidine 5'-nucleotidase [Chloroflexota bacterium]
MSLSTLFFDLDGTLYPNNNGLWQVISDRIDLYLLEQLHIPQINISTIRQEYFSNFGTTLNGIQAHHEIDAEAYLDFVHNVPVSNYLAPDPKLNELFTSLPQIKWIFTNSDRNHATRVAKALGIFDQIEGIIDVWSMDYRSKPNPDVYTLALELAGNPDPNSCLFADDIPINLAPAYNLGFTTVLVGEQKPNEFINYHLSSLHDLGHSIPALHLVQSAE